MHHLSKEAATAHNVIHLRTPTQCSPINESQPAIEIENLRTRIPIDHRGWNCVDANQVDFVEQPEGCSAPQPSPRSARGPIGGGIRGPPHDHLSQAVATAPVISRTTNEDSPRRSWAMLHLTHMVLTGRMQVRLLDQLQETDRRLLDLREGLAALLERALPDAVAE